MPSELATFLKLTPYQSFSHHRQQIPTRIWWLKMPQSLVSHCSVCWLGAGQHSAGPSWALLCSHLEGLGKLGLYLPGSQGSGDQRRSLKGLLTAPFRSHTSSPPTLHSFAQSKAGASPDSGRGEIDSTSWCKKQEIIVTSFTLPWRTILLKLSYWTGRVVLSTLASLAKSTGFPSWGWMIGTKSPKPTPKYSFLVNIWIR